MNDSEMSDRDRSEAQARVGSSIEGRWHVDALLGVGGAAAVFSATHARGRRAAFKILHARHRCDPEAICRLRDERRIVDSIGHPACVQIHGESVADDGTPMLVLELLEGETLHAAWRQTGRIAIAESLRIAEGLLDFLVACHGAGIVHRDLKPSNVFLADTPGGASTVKVLDFGTAMESARRRTHRRLALGTPSYMAPEQARGAWSLDGRADLFAVGAILYAMISGTSLRKGHEDDGGVAAAASEAARSIRLVAPGLPDAVARLIHRALAYEPGDRFADARAMGIEVRALRARDDLAWDPPPLVIATEHKRDSSIEVTQPGTPISIWSRLVPQD